MVHKFKLIFLILLIPTLLFPQFNIRKHIIGPSVGFSFLGSTLQLGLNHEYSISLTDLGIDDIGKLGIGGIFRYWNYSENFVNVDWNYTDILLGIQSNYHFYMANDKIDPWFGIIMAYNLGSADSEIKTIGYQLEEESHKGMWFGANAGIRYWFQDDWSVNIRIGLGTLSYGAVDLGIDYKLQ